MVRDYILGGGGDLDGSLFRGGKLHCFFFLLLGRKSGEGLGRGGGGGVHQFGGVKLLVQFCNCAESACSEFRLSLSRQQ